MKKIIILTICLTLLSLNACSDSSSTDKEKLEMPKTSTNTRRSEYNDSLVSSSAEQVSSETYINVKIRPQFVLHIDEAENVTEFESLNKEAGILSGQTTASWQGVHYSDAFRAIIEQSIIDGYISDNNPEITVNVTGANADAVTREVSTILDDLTTTHGLTVEIVLNASE